MDWSSWSPELRTNRRHALRTTVEGLFACSQFIITILENGMKSRHSILLSGGHGLPCHCEDRKNSSWVTWRRLDGGLSKENPHFQSRLIQRVRTSWGTRHSWSSVCCSGSLRDFKMRAVQSSSTQRTNRASWCLQHSTRKHVWSCISMKPVWKNCSHGSKNRNIFHEIAVNMKTLNTAGSNCYHCTSFYYRFKTPC